MSFEPDRVSVVDLEPASSDFLQEVIAGLSASPRTLPCKFFYDERGANLFQQICELPEYYVTRTEMQVLRDEGPSIAKAVGPGIELIGLGTGAGTKTRILLDHLDQPTAYIPVDISREQLTQSAASFGKLFPGLEVLPVCADYMQPVDLPVASRTPSRKIFYFPGSTIGNLEPEAADAFLHRIAAACGPNGGLIIGVDLQKSREILEPAYNDSAGVTAEFNLNLLVRANRELDANFDLAQWRHYAVYNSAEGRVEIFVISEIEQTIRICDHQFEFAAGEKIITEFSYKYSPEGFTNLAAQAGFRCERMWTDRAHLFGVFYLTVQS